MGAGPSGLLLALLLGKQGVSVEILEKSTTLDTQPRATHFSTPATYELSRAGVLEDIYKGGFVPESVCWRDLDGKRLGGLGIGKVFPEEYPHKLVCFPLDKMSPLLYEHVSRLSNIHVHWSHEVTEVGQDNRASWVQVNCSEGTRRVSADYVVGCDGGRSVVRHELFGEKFPGFTWYEQIVATNVLRLFPSLSNLALRRSEMNSEANEDRVLMNLI